MNSPIFVFPLLKILDIVKRISIRTRFTPAINAPIIDRKFFVEGGSFMVPRY
jgi:hypothetical protein